MNRKGILTVVSGFSGAGKGTVMNELLRRHTGYGLSISATTRFPRMGESHGNEYFFISREQFEEMIESDELIEWAEYVGNYYGTPRIYVEEQLEKGINVILEIEMQGALKVKERYPQALLLFITPRTAEELKSRLVGRGTESLELINKRLSRAVEETKFMEDYDYIVVNDDVKTCADSVHQIILNEHCRTVNNKQFITELKKDLNAFKEGDF